jgi:hypothetical protein
VLKIEPARAVFGSVGAESMVSSSVLNRVDGTPDYQYVRLELPRILIFADWDLTPTGL